MTTVTLETAQRSCQASFRKVLLGKRLLITLDRSPVAELVPAAKPKSRPVFGSAKGLIGMGDNFDEPLEDFTDYLS